MKKFDLEERTTTLAKAVIRLCRSLVPDAVNDRLIRQVVGSSGSIGANYREANDALGNKDFLQRMRIARREAKETMHWIECLMEANPGKKNELILILQETDELKRILSAIIVKVDAKLSPTQE